MIMIKQKGSWLLFIFLCSIVVIQTTVINGECVDHPDLVRTLPGYPAGVPPTCLYSGYLHYEFEGQEIHTHYTLIQAEMDYNNTKPLIYWSNGGPGASSLFGLLTELGPLLFSELSLQTDEYRKTNIPTPYYNEYAWTRLGHLLSFDQPAPIGFSYCNTIDENNQNPHSCGGIAWTDELTSKNAYIALQTFYNKFPKYTDKDLYLTGESYAGIYIPTLAREIAIKNSNRIKLKGFAVGDGCLGTETGICAGMIGPDEDNFYFDVWSLVFIAGHGQIPMSSFKETMKACHPHYNHDDDKEDFAMALLRGMTMTINNIDDKSTSTTKNAASSPECKAAYMKAMEQVGGVYAYGLYDECTYSNGLLNAGLNDYPCGGDIVMTNYLNIKEVQDALHVTSEFFSVDNAEGDFDYTPTEPDLTTFYKEMNGILRILVYNGDTDPAINSFAAQNWTSHLGLKEKHEWRPWTVDGCRKMGGYVTQYEGNFDYLTIRGAGHMVPTNKAAAAFTFIKAWINNEEYPTFDKDCEAPSISNNVKFQIKNEETS